MRVSELTGARLAYWVAKAEKLDTPNLINFTSKNEDDRECEYLEIDPENGRKNWALYEPHCNWAQGGPIIDREIICIMRRTNQHEYPGWAATVGDIGIVEFEDGYGWLCGPTPLIAAMRAFVDSKFGHSVPGDQS
jgi:hypothetical protein